MLVWIGLFGLIASFHGIIMGYSRQIFALARAGFLPPGLATVNSKTKTPVWAILAGGVVGIAAIFSDELLTIGGLPLTANIVTMSVFGAIVMYIMSMLSLFRLRQTEPALERPFKAPGFPVVPAIALGTALICLAAMIYYNQLVFALFVGLFAVAWLFYRFTADLREAAEDDDLLELAQMEARSMAD
jgi:ethanolamine permease